MWPSRVHPRCRRGRVGRETEKSQSARGGDCGLVNGFVRGREFLRGVRRQRPGGLERVLGSSYSTEQHHTVVGRRGEARSHRFRFVICQIGEFRVKPEMAEESQI